MQSKTDVVIFSDVKSLQYCSGNLIYLHFWRACVLCFIWCVFAVTYTWKPTAIKNRERWTIRPVHRCILPAFFAHHMLWKLLLQQWLTGDRTIPKIRVTHLHSRIQISTFQNFDVRSDIKNGQLPLDWAVKMWDQLHVSTISTTRPWTDVYQWSGSYFPEFCGTWKALNINPKSKLCQFPPPYGAERFPVVKALQRIFGLHARSEKKNTESFRPI